MPRDWAERESGRSHRQLLRQATAAAHEAVEASLESAAPETAGGYRRLLAAQGLAVERCERLLEAADVARLVPDWAERSRRAALAEDCRALAVERVAAEGEPQSLPTPAEALGMVYVLEGSRLGARLLHRRLQDNPDVACRAADRFLSHGCDERLWQSFVTLLEQSSIVAAKPDEAIAGAHRAFAIFSQAAAATETMFVD
ncbi:heme oxygenase [Sphingomonas ginkgonis]|uniref:Heme oxygenase n=1 Tax=Sphingomonas ginkgonis TaxID=2315330 RepID=A0A3R9YLG6_9SPHN|nr:biliverdin-producing heme oxygenase [Sphingomonas ginkgonis]RST30220.1 heme oxygenase [Sphingomonas ginkgonis]